MPLRCVAQRDARHNCISTNSSSAGEEKLEEFDYEFGVGIGNLDAFRRRVRQIHHHIERTINPGGPVL